MEKKLNILCVSRFFKGEDFMRSIHREGHNAYLLTSSKLDKESWPWEAIQDTFYMEENAMGKWNREVLINGLAYTMRSINFDRMVALDDFDVEEVAFLREYFRIPGMGETTSKHFRDKLAMRMKASEVDIDIPAFTSLFNDEDINKYTDKVSSPWMIKPRTEASATGIKKISSVDQLWEVIHSLGDKRHQYLLEKFAPGDVYHVDSLIYGGKVVFTKCSKYLDTPFEVAHGGGIFRSQTVPDDDEDSKTLVKINAKLMKGFGMKYSASHTEFIKNREDGKFYFVETSARVGGANLAEMVEAGTGINLWAEWAKIELAQLLNIPYKSPKIESAEAGIIVSLSRYEWPDQSSFTDKEIWWRMNKKWHIGMIVKSKDTMRVSNLLEQYMNRIRQDFHASLPPSDRPTN